MSSRLFQEIREERGLAYSVYSGRRSYTDTGLLDGLRRHVAGPGARGAKSSSRRGRRGSSTDGITDQELAVAAGYLEGSMLLGLEDSGSRMGRLGRSELSTVDGCRSTSRSPLRPSRRTTCTACCAGCSTGRGRWRWSDRSADGDFS